MIKNKLLASFMIGILGLAGLILPARAQTPGNLHLTTSPLPISLSTKPGTSVSTDLRVQNSGSQTERLKIDLYKFRAFGELGKPQILEREPGDDYFDWVSFSDSVFTAEPNVWKTIKMTIEVPGNAAYGYYYAVVFSRAEQNQPAAEQSTAIVGGSATLVLLEAEVPGAKRKMEVTGFSSDKKFYEFLPANFIVKLKNTGQVHGSPSGTIFLSRGGKQIATIRVNGERGNILPGSSRIFSTQWSDGFPVYEQKVEAGQTVLDGGGQPLHELKWDFDKPFNKLRFGKYTAKLVMVYDDGTRDVPIEGTLSFWVVPWRLLGGVLMVLAVLGFLTYRYITMRKRIEQLTTKQKQDKS